MDYIHKFRNDTRNKTLNIGSDANNVIIRKSLIAGREKMLKNKNRKKKKKIQIM